MSDLKELFTVRLPRFLSAQTDDLGEALKYLASAGNGSDLRSYRRGVSDHEQSIDLKKEEIIIHRLVDAYAKAKKDHSLAGEPYSSLGEWDRIIHVEYARLLKALQARDIPALRLLLGNFFRNECSRGFETNYLHRNPRRPLRQFWYINRFREVRRQWEEAGTGPFRAEDFSVPMIGNPVGMSLDGHLVPCMAIRHRYYAGRLRELTQEKRAVIAEIGGGFGGLAYFLLKESSAPTKYLNFDLPEINVVNGYFLLRAFSDRSIALYGESGDLSEALTKADIVVYPHFTFSRLADLSVDIVFNANSLSEMDETMVRHYFKEIRRVSRRFFMHVNHDDENVYDSAQKKRHVKLSVFDLEPEFRTVCHKKPSFYNKTYFEYLYERR